MRSILWALAALFIVMWVMGFAFHATFGGLIHVLLVLAVASVLISILTGRRLA